MCIKKMESATERISELIYDEEKIVTSVLLANELKISCGDAQNFINNFIKNLDQQKLEVLGITYLLYGKLTDGKSIGVYLVKDKDLDAKRSLFNDISTENVYSIQKGKNIDYNIIALTNSNCTNGLGVVKGQNCVKRNIKTVDLPSTTQSSSIVKQHVSFQTSKPVAKEDTIGKSNGNSKGTGNTKNQQSSQKPVKGKQGGIACFFSKGPTKTQTDKKTENIVRKVSQSDGNTSKSENEIETTDKTEQKSNSQELNEAASKAEEKIQTIRNGNEQTKSNERTTVDESNLQENKVQTVNKKRKKENKNKRPSKKRKRIQEICDSDSSDMFDDGETEDIVEMSDDEPPPAPIVTLDPPPKNKKRKAVDKTYLDEEGFMVTSTEYIYETVSEDDEKPPPKPKLDEKVLAEKKNDKINSQSKPSGSKTKANKKLPNGKQPTLMSFFKKS